MASVACAARSKASATTCARSLPPSDGAIPPECAVTIDAGPRTTYLPAESAALERYLQQGGSLLLMYDLGFALEPALEQLLETLGVRLPQAVVVDAQSHYGTDPEMVAVTAYEPHPITRNVSFTFYPGVRPLELVPPAAGIEIVPLVSSSADSRTTPVAAVAERQPERRARRRPGGSRQDLPQAQILAAASEGTLARRWRPPVPGDRDRRQRLRQQFLSPLHGQQRPRARHGALAAARRAGGRDRLAHSGAAAILLTKAQMQAVFLILVVLLPLSVIVFGSLVWWRRR